MGKFELFYLQIKRGFESGDEGEVLISHETVPTLYTHQPANYLETMAEKQPEDVTGGIQEEDKLHLEGEATTRVERQVPGLNG